MALPSPSSSGNLPSIEASTCNGRSVSAQLVNPRTLIVSHGRDPNSSARSSPRQSPQDSPLPGLRRLRFQEACGIGTRRVISTEPLWEDIRDSYDCNFQEYCCRHHPQEAPAMWSFLQEAARADGAAKIGKPTEPAETVQQQQVEPPPATIRKALTTKIRPPPAYPARNPDGVKRVQRIFELVDRSAPSLRERRKANQEPSPEPSRSGRRNKDAATPSEPQRPHPTNVQSSTSAEGSRRNSASKMVALLLSKGESQRQEQRTLSKTRALFVPQAFHFDPLSPSENFSWALPEQR